MEAPKAVQQLHRGDPGKSELPGDWTAAMGKEKARLGTEQRLPFPVPPQARHKHEPSSDTDFQQGKKSQKWLSGTQAPLCGKRHPPHSSPVFKVHFWSLSLPRDERAALVSAGSELILFLTAGFEDFYGNDITNTLILWLFPSSVYPKNSQ